MSIEYLHTMIRVSDLDATLRFFIEGLGLKEVRRVDNEGGRFAAQGRHSNGGTHL